MSYKKKSKPFFSGYVWGGSRLLGGVLARSPLPERCPLALQMLVRKVCSFEALCDGELVPLLHDTL